MLKNIQIIEIAQIIIIIIQIHLGKFSKNQGRAITPVHISYSKNPLIKRLDLNVNLHIVKLCNFEFCRQKKIWNDSKIGPNEHIDM